MGLNINNTNSGYVPGIITLDDELSNFGESILFTINFDEKYTDTLKLKTEVGVNVVERKSEDEFNLSDSSSIHITENLTDTYDFNDLDISFHIHEVHNMVLRITDAPRFQMGYHRTVGDSFRLQDPIALAIIDVYQEELPITEVFGIQVLEIYDETFGVSDSSTIAVKETENEELSINESVIIQISFPRPLATAGALGTFVLG